MKTTVEISAPLLERARHVAARDGETFRSLIEKGLSKELAERQRPPAPFKLRQVAVGGGGLHPDVAGKSWAEIIEISYAGRGA